MTRPPLRRHKDDRLLQPGATNAEIRCDYAVAPWDRVATEMERKWGIGRLPEFVPPAMAAKYGAAVAHMNDAINAGDAHAVAGAAENCIKGLRAMDAAATQAGHQPLHVGVWEFEHDGRRIAVVRDIADLELVRAEFPGVTIYTMLQVFNGMAVYDSTVVSAALSAFPGARISDIRPATRLERDLDDEIPF